MLFGKSKAKNSACNYCSIVNVIIAAIATIIGLVAIIGVFMAHVTPDGLLFGSISGSMAIIALTLNLFLVKKMAAACACQCTMPVATKKK